MLYAAASGTAPAERTERVEAATKPRRKRTTYLPGLRATRVKAGLTQDELAALASVQQATVSRLEWCDHSAQPRTLKKLSEALGVEPEVLMGDDGG